MRAGRLDTRVYIRQATETNTLGSNVLTFSTTRGSRWAHRRPLSTVEQYAASQRDASADYVFEFRSDSVTRAIIPKDRLLVGATSGTHTWYDVTGKLLDDRRRSVRVFAVEKHA